MYLEWHDIANKHQCKSREWGYGGKEKKSVYFRTFTTTFSSFFKQYVRILILPGTPQTMWLALKLGDTSTREMENRMCPQVL